MHSEPLRILYVDDEPDLREIAVLALELDEGLQVRACAGGQEAIESCKSWRPDLVLLDVMMPVMDGPTTLEGIRACPGCNDILAVFVTAGAPAAEVRPLRGGVLGVIPKPFDPLDLSRQVREFLLKAS